MSGQHVMIAGIGHCGTKWLSVVLNQPEQGVRFFHQHKYRISKMSWNSWQQVEDKTMVWEEYLEKYAAPFRKAIQKYRIVGDAISWMPLSIPKVHQYLPISRILYLVRNGIPSLHSLMTHSPFAPPYHNQWLFGVYLRRYWLLAGQPLKPWKRWSRWERTCFWWQTNAFMPGWLHHQLRIPVEVYRLEDLTQNVVMLEELTQSLGLKIGRATLQKMQRKDINRKVEGSRDPAVIWNAWTGQQRREFRTVCGVGMKKRGYKIPS